MVPDISRRSSYRDNLVVPDISRRSSYRDSMEMLYTSIFSSSSGSMVVPRNSSNGSMGGLVGLGTLDEGGISRNLLRHQERGWWEYITVSGVVPSGTRPPFAGHRARLRGRVVLVAHTPTCPDSAPLRACTPS